MRLLAFLMLMQSLIFASMSSQISAQTPIDVFFIAGQSNASGRVRTVGNSANSVSLAPNPNDDLVRYFFDTDGPSSIVDQTSGRTFSTLHPLPNTGYFGPEISAGRALVDLGYNVAIIKITKGSTSLSDDWNSRDFAANNGVLWRRWVTEAKVALDELSTQGPVRLRGFLWLQGESDSVHTANDQASNYERRFRSLVEDFYGVLGSGAVVGQNPTASGSEYDGAFIPVGATNGWGYDTSELQFVTALIHPRVSPEGLANFENGIEPFEISNLITVREGQIAVSNEASDRSFFDTVDLDLNDSTTNDHFAGAANDQIVNGVLVPGASGLQRDGTHFNGVANEQIGLRFATAIGSPVLGQQSQLVVEFGNSGGNMPQGLDTTAPLRTGGGGTGVNGAFDNWGNGSQAGTGLIFDDFMVTDTVTGLSFTFDFTVTAVSGVAEIGGGPSNQINGSLGQVATAGANVTNFDDGDSFTVTVSNISNPSVTFDGFVDVGTDQTAFGEGFTIDGVDYVRDTPTNGDSDPRQGIVFPPGPNSLLGSPLLPLNTVTFQAIGSNSIRGIAFQFSVSPQSCLLGDVNLSGDVDFFDISPFLAVLTSGTYQCEADCDQSGMVDFFDISPLLAIFAGL